MDKIIKTISITQFDYIIRNFNDEEVDVEGHLHHQSEFDRNGQPLKEVKYNQNGDFEEMFEYEYDGEGKLICESYYPEEEILAEKITFERNQEGLPMRALKHYQDGSVDTMTYQYDDHKKLIKKVTTNDEDEVEQIELFTWDNDTLSDHEILDGNGEPLPVGDLALIRQHETRTVRNEQGQIITEEELDDKGEVYMSVNRSYDDDGRSSEVEVFIDGHGTSISRHYILKYVYTFFD